MGKVIFFLGTKAQMIKMLPVIKEASDRGIGHSLILTGQHEGTIKEMFRDFRVDEEYTRLCDMGDVTNITKTVMWTVKVFYNALVEKRGLFGRGDIVVVHGDTLSTLYGAVIGRLLRLKVAHVEAGLRSHNLLDPFPEEFNRVLTSRLSHIHFCPGKWAASNLAGREGVVDTGLNTLYDSLGYALESGAKSPIQLPKKYAVCSIHRFENIYSKKRLTRIVECAESAAKRMPVVFVLHLPTISRMKGYGLYDRLARNPEIILADRMPYFNFIKVLAGSEYAITDGGSNQEECHYLGKPCIIMRNKTERPEGIGENAIISMLEPKTAEAFFDGYKVYERPRMSQKTSPSKSIMDALKAAAL